MTARFLVLETGPAQDAALATVECASVMMWQHSTGRGMEGMMIWVITEAHDVSGCDSIVL